MEKSKLEKQNGSLKIILLFIFLAGVSVVSVLGYHYYPTLVKSSEPWEKRAVHRERATFKTQDKIEQVPTNAVSPVQIQTGSTAKGAPTNTLQEEAGKFAGTWEFIGAKGIKYMRTYSSPRTENNEVVGDVADENNVNFAKYTIAEGNNLKLEILITNALNKAGENNAYSYKFSNNDKTFNLTRNGAVLSTWQRR